MRRRKSLIITLCSALAMLCFAAAGHAATYSVSPTGNNLTGDGSESSPWATLSYACSKVSAAGDIITLEAGTYNDSVQCRLAPGVSIQGAGKGQTTIVSNLNDWYIVAKSNPLIDGNQKISDFTLDGNNRALAHGIAVSGRNGVTIDSVDFVRIRATALQLCGYDWWTNADRDWPPVPPPGYAKGCSVTNVTMTGCSDVNYQAAFLLQSLEDLLIDNVVIDEMKSTGGKGNAIKSWPGWIKHSVIRNSSFTVDQTNPGEILSLEIWNFEKDTEVHNNTFKGGIVSLVSGRKEGGDLALKMYDNKFINEIPYGTAHELSLDDVEFYNNTITGEALGIWAATHMYNLDGVSNVNVHDNVISTANAQAITLQNGPGAVVMDNVRISGNTIDTTDRSWPDAGITVTPNKDTNFSNIAITGNTFRNLAYGVSFSGNNAGKILSPLVNDNKFSNVGQQMSDDGSSAPDVANNIDMDQPVVASAG